MKKVNPFLIIILALGVFGIITTEMGIIGVLPQVTQKFNISTSQSGWLVSIFALVVAISGPFLTLLASGINRKVILLTAVLIFAISNIVYAYTTMFEVMLIFRIIPAIFIPCFFSCTCYRCPTCSSGKEHQSSYKGFRRNNGRVCFWCAFDFLSRGQNFVRSRFSVWSCRKYNCLFRNTSLASFHAS